MSERDDWTTGIRARDPDVLDAVVRNALPALLRAARAAGFSAAEAEDLVQSTVLVFLRRADAFDGRATALTWMHGILVRVIMEQRRDAVRAPAALEPDDDVEAKFASNFDARGSWIRPPHSPALNLARDDVRRALAACLEGLPPRQRDAFVLREIDELDADALCKILQVTVNNLGVLLFRARARLRACLEHHGISGSADADV